MSVEQFDPKPSQQAPLALQLTAAASAHLKKQLARNPGQVLQLGIRESGCSGYMYELNLLATPEATDICYPVDAALSIFVRPEHLGLVRGTRIDYVVQGLNASLKFTNPNAETQCGCGESFSLKQSEAG